MKKIKDISNKKFGRLLVINFVKRENKKTYWNCLCDCGINKITTTLQLKSGDTKSCGCIKSPKGEVYKEKVKKRLLKLIIINENGCWEWICSLDKAGYASTCYVRNGRKITMKGYKVSYLVFIGEIPNDLWVLHKCDNRKCINPDHLFLGTCQDNHDDMRSKNRACDYKKALKGEVNHKSKLKNQDILNIKNLNEKGLTGMEISKIYNVDSSTIYKILKNTTWKHIL